MQHRLIHSLIFVLLFIGTVRAQAPAAPGLTPNAIAVEDVWTARQNRLIGVILDDIAKLKRKDQATAYVELGDTLWDRSPAEGAYWLKIGVEIGIDPATDYGSTHDQIRQLAEMLVVRNVLKHDRALGWKLLDRITGLLFEEARVNGPTGLGDESLLLAREVVPIDPTLAFRLGELAIKDSKYGFSSVVAEFINELRARNTALADTFLAELLENVRQGGDEHRMLNAVLWIDDQGPAFTRLKLKASLADRLAIVEVLATFINREFDALAANKSNDCRLTAFHGTRFPDEFRQLPPNAQMMLEGAVALCREGKPEYFAEKKLLSAREYYATAEKTVDPEQRARYFFAASDRAAEDKDYRFALRALDRIAEGQRSVGYWDDRRIELATSLNSELAGKRDDIGIDRVIDAAPPRHRAFILLRTLKNYSDPMLLERAKAEFRKMDFAPPERTYGSYRLNPATFVELVSVMGRRRNADLNQVVNLFAEYVDFQNQLTGRFTNRTSDGKTLTYSCFSSPPPDLLDTGFESFHQLLGRVENVRLRLTYRLSFLSSTVHRNGGGGTCGIAEIDS